MKQFRYLAVLVLVIFFVATTGASYAAKGFVITEEEQNSFSGNKPQKKVLY